jgi:IS30 family transposase
VGERLRRFWSPQQIAARLRLKYPGQPEKWVSHQTIYYSLEVMPRGELKRELLRCLRLKTKRGPRAHKDWIPEAMSIHNRPAEIEPRRVPGHWEGDLLIGRASSSAAVGTLVERTTRYVSLVRIPTRDAYTVYRRFAAKFVRVPAVMRKTLTYDRGREMAEHERLATKVGIDIYFADPHSPWQRGSNENTNGLLRQYFPRGTDLSRFSQAYLNKIALRLNQRPRKTLGFETPADRLRAVLH